MVTFTEGRFGFNVIVGGRVIGYITREKGFLMTSMGNKSCIQFSASDLLEIAKKVTEIENKKMNERKVMT